MIDLRFHIISLVAVFLSLALGILLGSSVIQGAIVDRLESDIRRYREERDDAVDRVTEREAESRELNTRLRNDFTPWSVHQRLEGAAFVVVSDGALPPWRDHVLAALESAGADPAGTIVLEDKWQLRTPEDRDDLIEAVQNGAATTLARGDEMAETALGLLGERFFEEPDAGELIDELESAGFISVPDRADGDWPPPGSIVVVLSAARASEETVTPGATTFVSTLAEEARAPGALVLSDRPEDASLVRALRDDRRLPDSVSTFDSATDETDPGGLGIVAALVAATEGRGGHFGSEEGRTFVAPPSSG